MPFRPGVVMTQTSPSSASTPTSPSRHRGVQDMVGVVPALTEASTGPVHSAPLKPVESPHPAVVNATVIAAIEGLACDLSDMGGASAEGGIGSLIPPKAATARGDRRSAVARSRRTGVT